jgi:aspartate aminotransferase
MRPQISHRASLLPASPIRKLMPLADDARKRGVHVYHLNIGQPDLPTPAAMRERLVNIPEIVAYSPSAGTAECLAVLQRYYEKVGLPLQRNEIIATAGGSEAVLFAVLATCNDGDEILIIEPFYTNYTAFATMAGVRLVPVASRGEDGFHLPPIAELERARTPRTRAVILCNPNNPTGTVYTRAELEAIGAFCREHGLFLISDEVYREFVYDGREVTSALTLPGLEEHVILVDSLSKRFSACGLRLGCLATRNPEVYQASLRMAQGRLSPPGLAQLAALGIDELDASYYQGIVKEYQARRDVLFEGLSAIPGLFLRKPEGAFYFVARLPIQDGDDFATYMLSEYSLDGATVMVAPAKGFYASPHLGADEVRIAYVLEKRDLEASVRILAEAIPAYRAARGLA